MEPKSYSGKFSEKNTKLEKLLYINKKLEAFIEKYYDVDFESKKNWRTKKGQFLRAFKNECKEVDWNRANNRLLKYYTTTEKWGFECKQISGYTWIYGLKIKPEFVEPQKSEEKLDLPNLALIFRKKKEKQNALKEKNDDEDEDEEEVKDGYEEEVDDDDDDDDKKEEDVIKQKNTPSTNEIQTKDDTKLQKKAKISSLANEEIKTKKTLFDYL